MINTMGKRFALVLLVTVVLLAVLLGIPSTAAFASIVAIGVGGVAILVGTIYGLAALMHWVVEGTWL